MLKLRRVCLLSAVFIALGCTHAQRGPAADLSAKTLDQAPGCTDLFNATFSPDALELSYENGKYIYSEIRKYVDTKYVSWVHDFMAAADQTKDCETERDVDLYFNDITTKIGIFGGRIRKNSENVATQAALARPEFSDKEMGAQLACYSQCAVRRMQATKFPKKSCQETCGTEQKLADFFENTTALKRLAQACFFATDEKGAQREREEYAANYQRVIPAFLAKLQAIEASVADELTSDRRLLATLNQLRVEFYKWKSARVAKACGPANYPWLSAVTRANVLLRSASQEGSGFYVNTSVGRYLVTAVHVSEPNLKAKIQQMMQVILSGGKAGKSVRFDILPGLVAMNGDISLAKQDRGTGLELAGDDEIPKLGQRFYVAGYPGFAGERFQVLRCTFYGFGPRLGDGNQKEASYLLRCPGTGDLHGISGGPMIDEKGKVWGVNTVGVPYISTLRVAPLAQDKNGEPKIGIQQTFLSDLCYATFEYEPHRCEVMPNMYEKDVP